MQEGVQELHQEEVHTFGHGLNYHHPGAGDKGYQFYMPPGTFSSLIFLSMPQ